MIITEEDFIASYNHTLSSTFSHPTLPFIHHVHNWSACPRVIRLPANSQPSALSFSENLLAVAAEIGVFIYNTEGDMDLNYTLKGAGLVDRIQWVPGDGRILVSSESGEDSVRFWDLNLEDSLVPLTVDLDNSTTAVVTPLGGLVVQPN